jgi:hypothetical protein
MALPAGAQAATQVGDACVANDEFFAPITFFEASPPPGNPLPISAPSAGVVTQWKVSVVPGVPFSFPQTMKILRLNTGSHTAQVIGEASGTLSSGENSFATRIPVQAGDRVSLYGAGPIKTLVCLTPAEPNPTGGFEGNGGGVGSTNPYLEEPEEFRVPVVAVVEPDADNDGYGDETQDGCPQSAAFHSACPAITIDSFSLPAKGAVKIVVSVSSAAPVSVAGTVKTGKGKPVKLKAPTRTLQPGTLNRFKLAFPAKLKSALGDLSPSRSLQLKVTAKATSAAGAVSADHLKVKLKGQG